MGYGGTPQAPDILAALTSMDADTATLAAAVSGNEMQVDLANVSLSYDGAFYNSSSGYGIADLLYDSSGGSVANMLYDSSGGSLAYMVYSRLCDSSYEPFWYSGYSLSYMMYELYNCISGGRLMTSPDNY